MESIVFRIQTLARQLLLSFLHCFVRLSKLTHSNLRIILHLIKSGSSVFCFLASTSILRTAIGKFSKSHNLEFSLSRTLLLRDSTVGNRIFLKRHKWLSLFSIVFMLLSLTTRFSAHTILNLS